MYFYNKIIFLKEKFFEFYSDKNLFILFSIWLVTFFFGSTIGSVSFSFFTIYPNFIIGILFIPLIIKFIKTFHKSVKIYIVFLSLFILHSIFWIFFNEKNYYSIFELRSNIFYLNTFLIIISSYSAFKSKLLFNKALKTSVWLWLFCNVIFGFFEVFFDFHIKSEFYSLGEPMFIYGNPNDYILNCILFFCILLFIDKKLTEDLFKIIFCLITIFILSIYAKARIGELIILILFILVLIKKVTSLKFIIINKYYILLFIICLLLLFRKSILIREDGSGEFKLFSYFNNIVKSDTIKTTKKSIINDRVKTSINQNDFIVPRIKIEDSPLVEGGILLFSNLGDSSNYISNSNNVILKESSINKIQDESLKTRIKLIENGIYLIKTHPMFGVGPGQFQELNKLKKVPNDIGNNCSPHNYFIELISNYAILAISFFIFLIVLLSRFFIYKIQNSFWLIVAFFCFCLASFMPSAFTYQPINWFFMTLWVLYSQISINDKT
jgi:hypothetical protein